MSSFHPKARLFHVIGETIVKHQIDKLVQGIYYDLARPSPAIPELAAYLQFISADSFSRAVKQRAILASWAEELPDAEIREYARQQLEALLVF